MRRLLLLAAALLAVPLAGCLEGGPSGSPVGGGGGGTQTEDVNRTSPPIPIGVPLVAHLEYSYHSGVWGIHAYPNSSEAGPAPAFCVAYRDSATHEGDSCEVEPDSKTIHGGPEGEDFEAPWTVRAEWARGSRDANVSVIAYDAQESAVAWWNGARHPFMAYMTE